MYPQNVSVILRRNRPKCMGVGYARYVQFTNIIEQNRRVKFDYFRLVRKSEKLTEISVNVRFLFDCRAQSNLIDRLSSIDVLFHFVPIRYPGHLCISLIFISLELLWLCQYLLRCLNRSRAFVKD